CARGGAVDYW
nr:immunoglobulin heavy chain junction region [Mus musculus]